MSESPDNPRHTVHFTIDGRPFSTDQPEQTAAALVTLAGLDPAGYDLGEIRPGNAEPKVFEDADVVHIHEGEKFVSIREQATVA
jgi:Multiubiquitin